MSQLPAYKEIYLELKKEFKEGMLKPGTLLPPEHALEEKFNVSRTTIRKAISLLAAEGYVRVKQGYGTEVLDILTVQKLNYITSITETLRQKGYDVKTESMFIEKIDPPDSLMNTLNIDNSDNKVYKIQRVQTADNAPIAIMTNYIKAEYTPNLERFSNTFSSLYSFLEKQYNITFTDAVQYLSAVSASFTEAQILKIATGAPLLCSRRVCYSNGDAFLYGITKLVSDKYEYCTYLQNRPH